MATPSTRDIPVIFMTALTDEDLHALLEAADNRRLVELNTSNSEHSFNYRIAEAYSDEQAMSAVAGHARILAAIKARDPDRADAEARSHVMESLATNLRLMR